MDDRLQKASTSGDSTSSNSNPERKYPALCDIPGISAGDLCPPKSKQSSAAKTTQNANIFVNGG